MSPLETKLKAQLPSLYGVAQVLYEEAGNKATGQRHILNLEHARRLVKAQLKRTREILEGKL